MSAGATRPPGSAEHALAGVFPVLATPFDDSGAVDLASLERLVDFVLASGADGLTVGGVASEVHKLDDGERRAIVERVLARVSGRAPVWVGTGHQGSDAAIAHSRHAQEHGAAGVMVMPPWVARPSLGAIAAFFRDLDAALSLPMMIQDAPLVSGLHLPVEWLLEVASSCRHVRAIKVEAPPTGPKTSELVARGEGRLALFGGLGAANLLDELRRGAAGTLPGSAIPEVVAAIVRRFRDGDLAGAAALHERALPWIRFAGQSIEWSYHATKRLLVRRGVIASATVRRPTSSFDGVAQLELEASWTALEPQLLGLTAR